MSVRNSFDGVRVFSATMYQDREQLGERVTDWLAKNPTKKMVDLIVTQSSDASFHMVAITVFWKAVS